MSDKIFPFDPHGREAPRLHASLPAMIYQIARNRSGEFRFLYVSDGCRDIYHMEPESVLADIAAVLRMIVDDDLAGFLAAQEKSATTLETFQHAYRIVTPDGKQKWLRTLSRPARHDDGSIVWTGVLFEVTPEHMIAQEAESDARKSRQSLRQLSLVLDAGQAINTAPTLEAVMQLISDWARQITQSHQAVTLFTYGRSWQQAIGGVSLSDKYAAYRDYDEPPTGEGIYRLITETKQPMRLTDAQLRAHRAFRQFSQSAEAHPPLRGWMGVPLLTRDGTLLGLVHVSDRLQGEFTQEDEIYLSQFARIAAWDLELRLAHARLEDRVAMRTAELMRERTFLRNLLDLRERERKQVSYEIHDGFVQSTVAAQMFLEAARGRLIDRKIPIPDELEQVSNLIEQAILEGRRMIGELRPMILDEEGLAQSMCYLAEEEKTRGLGVRLHLHDVPDDIEPMVKQAIFRVAQEALSNIRRHSGANRATLRLTHVDGQVRLYVRDQGTGFDPATVGPESFGLRSIEERTRLFGGDARVRSKIGKGTLLFAQFPINRD